MLNIFFIDKDVYLNSVLGIKYKDTFNKLESNKKYGIIDKLVKRVKYGGNTDTTRKSFIGLVLIFEATFKSLNTRFFGSLSKYGYSSDEFMLILIDHMREKIKTEFKCKHEKGFMANFNRFIQIKLRSKALCLLSKEQIYRKYKDKMKDVYSAKVKYYGIDSTLMRSHVQTIKKQIIKVEIENEKDETIKEVYRLFLDNYNNAEIVDIINELVKENDNINKISINKVNAVIKKFKEVCRFYFSDAQQYIGDNDV
jgi:hypothetical protein